MHPKKKKPGIFTKEFQDPFSGVHSLEWQLSTYHNRLYMQTRSAILASMAPPCTITGSRFMSARDYKLSAMAEMETVIFA